MNDTTKAPKAPAPPKRVKVKLTAKGHRHHGVLYEIGDIIEVAENSAKWLVEHTLGELYTGPDAAKNASN